MLRTRVFGIFAHVDAGKTTLSEQILYLAGIINKLGSVDKGSTSLDTLHQEKSRGITIRSATSTFNWRNGSSSFEKFLLNKELLLRKKNVNKKSKMNSDQQNLDKLRDLFYNSLSKVTEISYNKDMVTYSLVDTPGHIDFALDVHTSMKVIDLAVILFDTGNDSFSQTIPVIKLALEKGLPLIGVATKIDAGHLQLEQFQKAINKTISTGNFKIEPMFPQIYYNNFIIDLVTLRWYKDLTLGGSILSKDWLDSHEQLELIFKARESYLENLALYDDLFAELYDTVLKNNELPIPNIRSSISLKLPTIFILEAQSRLSVNQVAFQILLTSGKTGMGVPILLDNISNTLDLQNSKSINSDDGTNNIEMNPKLVSLFNNQTISKNKKIKIFVFKVMTHGSKRKVYFRVLEGDIENDTRLVNMTAAIHRNMIEITEIKKIFNIIAGDTHESITRLEESMIGMAEIIGNCITGDTICNYTCKPELGPQSIPEPIYARTFKGGNKLKEALQKLIQEDPAIRLEINLRNELVVWGSGDLHLEIVQDRLLTDFNLSVEPGEAHVQIKERLSQDLGEADIFLYNTLFKGKSIVIQNEITNSTTRQSSSKFHISAKVISEWLKNNKESM